MISRRVLLLWLLPFTAAMMHAESQLDELGIEIRGISRSFVYTNTQDASFFAETHAPNRVSWQGFMVHGHEFLDDYTLEVNGTILDRSAALKTIVYPDRLERTYPGGIVEEVRPVDSLAVIAVHVRSVRPVAARLIAYFADGEKPGDFSIRLMSGIALVARPGHVERTPAADYPVWLAIGSQRALPETSVTVYGRRCSPLRITGYLSRTHIFAIGVANAPDQAEALVRTYPDRSAFYAAARRTRMERLLAASDIRTSNDRFDKALRWAKLSLDALIMNQTGRGIFAGLPWFNNYWGRDTFIALPGATLVTERFALAREILDSFAAFQERDSLSTDYGRIPNIVTVTDTAYNTADGTPRFVDIARDYIMRAGDEKFLLRIYPVILRSIEGTLKYHTDSLDFLIHADAETWMDAVGPTGPWSPRGNRANDIQALWARQLEAGIWCASRLGDYVSARRWDCVLQSLKRNFTARFVTPGGIADHLLPEGPADMRVRPNQLFTGFLLNDLARAAMVRAVMTELTYPYGVASLAQTDSGFHPFHEYPPFYPKDAAYHNGTVWTWLQGQLISELCRDELADSAFILTMNSVHQILDRGAVGTQSELMDALTRPGEQEPRLSGTVSQAWNLAEFIRNVYDDYLGIRIERTTRRVFIRPHLPAAMGSMFATFQLDGQPLSIAVRKVADTLDLTLACPGISRPFAVDIALANGHGEEFKTSFALASRAGVAIRLHDTTFTASSTAPDFKNTVVERNRLTAKQNLGPVAFARPRSLDGLKALRGPSYPLLSHVRIQRANPHARPLVIAQDPLRDDTGVVSDMSKVTYTYPANVLIRPGSFDIEEFSATYDDSLMYFSLQFRTLSDPGWHPEYGFQLTFAAIAIDTDGLRGSGQQVVPANADYSLPPERAYERIICVGGGFDVRDASGKVLVAYVPTEEAVAAPFGDTRTGTVRFAIPLRYLGVPGPRWHFTVLAGCQDDHGGAGIGEFRTIHKDRGEWNGGGKAGAGGSNVYDILRLQ